MEGYDKAGCIFATFWDEPVLIQPSGQGGTNWSPMPYDPDTGYLYVPGTIRTSVFSRVPSQYATGKRYTNGEQHDWARRIVVPDVVVHLLEMPGVLTGFGVKRDNRGTEQVVAFAHRPIISGP